MPNSSTPRTPYQTRSRTEATPVRPTADKSTNTAKTKAPARNMANFDQLAQVITQFVNRVDADRAVQHQQQTALFDAIAQQQDDNAALRNLVTAQVAAAPPPNPLTQPVAESIPKFEGKILDDAQRFIDHVNRVADAEGWDDDQKLQLAIRRLTGTAFEWHVQVGHGLMDWPQWSLSLLTTFRRRLTMEQWQAMVTARVQLPGESGIAYALEKARICRLAPVNLTEAQIVPYLINGLSKWEHVAAMMNNPPADATAFIERIRQLEQLGVSSRISPWAIGPVPTVPPANPTLPQFTPLPPTQTPQAQQPPASNDLMAAMETLGQHLATQLALQLGKLNLNAGRRGQDGGPRKCYNCQAVGHIARFCPLRQGNGQAGPRGAGQ